MQLCHVKYLSTQKSIINSRKVEQKYFYNTLYIKPYIKVKIGVVFNRESNEHVLSRDHECLFMVGLIKMEDYSIYFARRFSRDPRANENQ